MTPDSNSYWSVICEVGVSSDEEADIEHIVERTILGWFFLAVYNKISQFIILTLKAGKCTDKVWTVTAYMCHLLGRENMGES